MCFVTNLDGNLWKVLYFMNKLVIFYQKIKDIGVIVWQICKVWSKTQNSWDWWVTVIFFRGNWARSEQKKGVLRALHSIPSNMGVPPGFILSYNLNFIKYLLVILIFSTPASRHKCIKEQHACSNKSGNPGHSAEVLNSDFHLCLYWKPHLQNIWIDLRDFLTQTAKGRRHIESKIQLWIWRTHS